MKIRTALLIILTLLLLASPLHAIQGERRNFDAREQIATSVTRLARQNDAEISLRRAVPGLLVTYDDRTRVARTIYNTAGPLSTGPGARDPIEAAIAWARQNILLLGLQPDDLADYEVTDTVRSGDGSTHVYFRQRTGGVPLYNGQLQVTLDAARRVLIVNNAFLPNLKGSANTLTPRFRNAAAIEAARKHVNVPAELEGGPPKLMLLPIRFGEAQLVWNLRLRTLDSQHVYEINVDAVDGKIWTRFDLVANDSYKVFPPPVESPKHTTPVYPADGRLVLTPNLSWFDGSGFTRGNNVDAYHDWTNANVPPANRTNCTTIMNCNFTLPYGSNAQNYVDAATANLFYWNNYIHDATKPYGFDEISGNFQKVSSAGLGNDEVQAQAQDGGGTNNANFYTPVDGQKPRMQMYLWSGPYDGDLDQGVIAHEYGHGISNRLVGGPSNVSCLQNTQQPGEGWSDFFALVFTHRAGAQGMDGRGIGTFVLGQSPSGLGIRAKRYSTDSAINNWTYASISSGMSVPHGVGSVWAEALWRGYWSLIDRWGWSPSLTPVGNNGNHRMMRYVIEGMKSTACSPTFTQARDGILTATSTNYGGTDYCRLWTEFARFGLGSNANPGGSNTLAVTNGFDVPPSCRTDVWSKDDASDNGVEPSNPPIPYVSDDVWVRRNADNQTQHEDPKQGVTNFVYVTVRNRGTIDAHNVHVEVWGTAAATTAAWPGNWTKIGVTTAVHVPAGGSVNVSLPWVPPLLGHYCLMALLQTPQDPLTVPMTGDPGTDTVSNNNVIWHNVNVVQMLWDQPVTVTLLVRNRGRASARHTISFTADRGAMQALLSRTTIDVALPRALAATPAAAPNARIASNGVLRVSGETTLPATLPAGAEYLVTLTFRPTRRSADAKPYRFHVVQRDEKGKVIGGVAYDVYPPK